MQPVTVTVPDVPFSLVAVIVVELVSVRYAKSLDGLFATDGLTPPNRMNAPDPTVEIVAVADVLPLGIVMLNCWTLWT